MFYDLPLEEDLEPSPKDVKTTMKRRLSRRLKRTWRSPAALRRPQGLSDSIPTGGAGGNGHTGYWLIKVGRGLELDTGRSCPTGLCQGSCKSVTVISIFRSHYQ